MHESASISGSLYRSIFPRIPPARETSTEEGWTCVIFDIFDIPSQVEEEESRGEIRNVELKEINWDDWRAPIFFSIR